METGVGLTRVQDTPTHEQYKNARNPHDKRVVYVRTNGENRIFITKRRERKSGRPDRYTKQTKFVQIDFVVITVTIYNTFCEKNKTLPRSTRRFTKFFFTISLSFSRFVCIYLHSNTVQPASRALNRRRTFQSIIFLCVLRFTNIL